MIRHAYLWAAAVSIATAISLVITITSAAQSSGGTLSSTFHSEPGTSAQNPATLHNNNSILGCGLGWHIVPSPNGGAGDNTLYDVAQAAPDQIWAVGDSG